MALPLIADAWPLACDEYARGEVGVIDLHDPEYGVISIAATASWQAVWHSDVLSPDERQSVAAGCVQIATGPLHPCLGAMPLAMEPIGAWVACPANGVQVTWRTHAKDPEVRVLLTLAHHPEYGPRPVAAAQ